MSSFQVYSDQQLVALLKAGDELAFNEIYSRYSLRLYYQANQMLRDQEAAKDLVQELFITLWGSAVQLKPDINLAGYLYVAVRNRVFKLIEKGKVRNDYLSAIAKYATEISTQTMDELNEKELQLILQREIDLLPPRMREIFEMSRQQNLSHSEIALQLGISDKTVKKQINKVLKILRLKLGCYAATGLMIELLLRP
jgi:RNA polymerase sigma-70 factor (family 1)